MEDRAATESRLSTLVADILAEARRQGADAAEVSASADAGLAVSVRKHELENLEFNQDQGFGITLYLGKRKGSASTTDAAAIADTVAAARRIAKHTEDDACSGLADAEHMPQALPELDLYHPWAVTPEQATELARECEAAGLEVDKRITNSDGAQVSAQRSVRVYGNSHGFIGAQSGTRQAVSCVLIGEDEAGMQRDYWYTIARSADDLEAVQAVGRTAGERTVGRLSPRTAPTGSYPVLFAPTMASGLIGHLIGAISGGAQYRKASFLLDALGETVLPEWMSLVEKPHIKKALGSAGFDGDGVATREQAFIEQGRIASYVLSTYSARKLNLTPTGNAGGVHNLELQGPAVSPDDLLAQMGEGLLVTELMGQGVNGVTGDYSRGAAGFWVSQGKIQYPVAEVTIAGNLRDMYANVVGLGDDVDLRGNIRAPSILLSKMMLAGQANG